MYFKTLLTLSGTQMSTNSLTGYIEGVFTSTCNDVLFISSRYRSALKMVNKEKLSRHIEERRHDIPSDQNLRDRGYNNSIWNRFKHTQVKTSLKEAGNLRYLSRPHSAMVRERPPSPQYVI